MLAPGASLNENIAKILSCVKENDCTTVGVAFVPNFIECNYVFLSNLKRYKTTFNPTHKKINLIHTSNKDKIMVNYSSLLNEDDTIRDNSSLMFLNMLAKFSPIKIYIAGMDGYDITNSNYYQDRLVIKHDMEQAIALNAAISKRIEQLKNQLNIEFITPTLYVK